MIVSNSAGLDSSDPSGAQAEALERATGVTVLRHATRKPACGPEIMQHFQGKVDSPSQIAVIGDRLFTDTIMANTMGAYSIWIRDGVVPDNGIVTRLEKGVSTYLLNHRYFPPEPF